MKKSQTQAGSIAVLIVLIALFMALYLLFLPQKERLELLGENQTNETGTQRTQGQGTLTQGLLLSQSPGSLKPFEKDTNTHDIDAVNLYVRAEPITIDLANSLTISKSLFSENKRELRFNIDDLNNLDQVTLFFLVNNAKGNLIISLNDVEIYNNKAQGLKSVTLPVDLIQKTNKLTFTVSSPGFNIFAKNSYTLSEIKVRESFEITNTKEQRTFTLTASESGDAKLNFFVFCNNPSSKGRLRVFVNNEEIANEVLGCASADKSIEIDKESLKEGKNTLLFEIDKGDYLVNDIKLEVNVEEGGSKTYKFSVTKKQFDDILDSGKEVKLSIKFNDVGDDVKKATININNNEFTLETKDLDYERFITSLIDEGNNFIKITPQSEFDIELLEIKIES